MDPARRGRRERRKEATRHHGPKTLDPVNHARHSHPRTPLTFPLSHCYMPRRTYLPADGPCAQIPSPLPPPCYSIDSGKQL